MILSQRLLHIANMIPRSKCLADIGTDHGYIPIFSVLNNISERAIASDINEGPIKSADYNIRQYGLEDKVATRIGSGLSTIRPGEADSIVIAGMGGNLISDIISAGSAVACEAETIILQPVQNPEVLRKYLVHNNYKIVDEDLVKDDNKLYHIIKATSGTQQPFEREVYYYTGKHLLEKGNPLLAEYLEHKISVLSKILSQLSSEEHPERFKEIEALLCEFEEVKGCL